jgi:hypothetical protein
LRKLEYHLLDRGNTADVAQLNWLLRLLWSGGVKLPQHFVKERTQCMALHPDPKPPPRDMVQRLLAQPTIQRTRLLPRNSVSRHRCNQWYSD